jgi:hypothetical protein
MLENGSPQRASGKDTCNTGASAQAAEAQSAVSDRKICALGVQVTRGVTAHGVGLNVRDEPIENNPRKLYYKDSNLAMDETSGYLSYGFSRIVACGLEGKSTTWLSREGAYVKGLTVPNIAGWLAWRIAEKIEEMGAKKGQIDGVETVELGEGEIAELEAGKVQIGELIQRHSTAEAEDDEEHEDDGWNNDDDQGF